MQKRPVENTKKTATATANSHVFSGNLSDLGFFAEGESSSSPFSSSLVAVTFLGAAIVRSNQPNLMEDVESACGVG